MSKTTKILSGLVVTVIFVCIFILMYFFQVNKVINPALFGSWDLFEVSDIGMKAQIKLLIDKDQVQTSTTCLYQDKKVHVQVASQANISNNEIHILEDNIAQKEYSPGFLKCKASIEKTILKYELLDKTLLITMPDNNFKMQLVRSSETFIPAKKSTKSDNCSALMTIIHDVCF